MQEDHTRRATGVAHPVDVHVGTRIRQQRTLKGLSQGRLGAAVGLTFQQVQKYERGANRVGASRLFEISQILEVPISFFFEGLEYDVLSGEANLAEGVAEESQLFEDDIFKRKETLDLVRAYYRIQSPEIRNRLFELARSMETGIPETGLPDESD